MLLAGFIIYSRNCNSGLLNSRSVPSVLLERKTNGAKVLVSEMISGEESGGEDADVIVVRPLP